MPTELEIILKEDSKYNAFWKIDCHHMKFHFLSIYTIYTFPFNQIEIIQAKVLLLKSILQNIINQLKKMLNYKLSLYIYSANFIRPFKFISNKSINV